MKARQSCLRVSIAEQRQHRAALMVLAACTGSALFLGMIMVLSLPAARAIDPAFGWRPLWLLGMPLASLGALALRSASGRLDGATPMFSRRRRIDTWTVARRRTPAIARAAHRHAA